MDQSAEVRKYYEVNTPAFERFDAARGIGAIHRAVWAPGVRSRAESLHYVDGLISSEIDALRERFGEPIRVIDFGCGLGASLVWLALRRPILGLGVTLSRAQVRRADERIRARDLTERVRCIEGDFLALPEAVAPAQLAFSIEAFVHSSSPQAFFEAAARKVVPGGTLVVCDDFLTPRATGTLTIEEASWLDEFAHGWLASSLVTAEAADRLARDAGFERVRTADLSNYLELGRPRDRLVGLIVSLGRRWPVPGYRWRSLVGGDALQRALTADLIEYRYTAWTRRA